MEPTAMLRADYADVKLANRFWKKVLIAGTDECWNHSTNALKGRGLFKVGTKNEYAPRISWVLTYGDLQAGQCVLHKCDNPACVNPSHLFIGTKAENNVDRDNKGRQAKGTNSGRTIISEQDVRLIRSLIAEGKTLRHIETLGYSYTAIVDIKRGKSWAWFT